MHNEVVGRFKWMNDEEFGDVLALGNSLPGPINTKMAGYIGYQVGGWIGMINGVLATVLPTVILMIGLIGVLSSFRESRVVAGMTQAVAPVVGVMLIVLTYTFLKQSASGLTWTMTIVLSIVSFVLYGLVGVHPSLIVGALLLIALLKKDKQQSDKKAEISS